MASSGDWKGRNRKRQVDVNENSPVIKAFRGYQTELDAKHDRHERIVKLSRDITIESKRVIFLLQRCAGDEDAGKQKVLDQAQAKLKEIQQTKFLQLAEELKGHDHFQFLRAYSPGLQEYIEAVSFWYYLKDGSLISLADVEKDLKFPASCVSGVQNLGTGVSSSSGSGGCQAKDSESSQNIPQGSQAVEVSSTSEVAGRPDSASTCTEDFIFVTIPPMEFMLGVADLTGELMRTAIMSVSEGNLDFLVEICRFMRIIHDAFVSYGNTARELNRKMGVLRQSLEKVENACYTLKVRGSEIPKHMLANIFSASSSEAPYVEDMEESNYD